MIMAKAAPHGRNTPHLRCTRTPPQKLPAARPIEAASKGASAHPPRSQPIPAAASSGAAMQWAAHPRDRATPSRSARAGRGATGPPRLCPPVACARMSRSTAAYGTANNCAASCCVSAASMAPSWLRSRGSSALAAGVPKAVTMLMRSPASAGASGKNCAA